MKSLKVPASVIISASLLLGSTPLYARDLIRSVETGKNIHKQCWTLPGTQQGRCVNDVNKQWQREKQLFLEEQKAKVKAWKLEHSHLGVSEEYRKLHAEFTKKIQAETRAFTDAQNTARKEFFALMDKHAGTGSSTSSSRSAHTQTVDTEAEEAAKIKCSKIKDDRAQRICLRQVLRMNDPNATARGGASWRSRGQ